jgi:hypothetical protein
LYTFPPDKPEVTVPNFPERISAPGSLKLNFSADSNPASNVTIYHKKKMLEFFSDFTGDKEYEIEISSCLDKGEYEIVAENIIGSHSFSKNLKVKCKYLENYSKLNILEAFLSLHETGFFQLIAIMLQWLQCS